MAKFEVGQKVKVNYRGWEGEGIVRKITPENWHHVDMLTGNYAHVQGDFNASDLEPIPTVFQPGDIVRAEKGERAVENKVQHFGSTANTTLWLDDVRLTTWESDGYALTLVKRPEPEIVLPTKYAALVNIGGDYYIRGNDVWFNAFSRDKTEIASSEIIERIAGTYDAYEVIFEGENE